MATEVERLITMLEARISGYERELRRAQQVGNNRARQIETRFQRMNRTMTTGFVGMAKQARGALGSIAFIGPLAGIASFTGAIAKARQAISEFDRTAKDARATGLSGELYQSLRFGAEEAGVSQGRLNSALERFNRAAAEASIGKGRMISQLRELNPELLRNIQAATTQEERIRLVSDAMKNARDETERNAIAFATLGRDAAHLIPVFAGGSEAIDTLVSRAKELGLVVREETLARAEELENQLGILTRVINTQLNEALIELAPLLVRGAQGMADIASAINEIVTLLKSPSIQSLFDLVAMIASLGDNITPMGALESIGRWLEPFISDAKAGQEEVVRLETSLQRLKDRLDRLKAEQAGGAIIPPATFEITQRQIDETEAKLQTLKAALEEAGAAGQKAGDDMAAGAQRADEAFTVVRHSASGAAEKTRELAGETQRLGAELDDAADSQRGMATATDRTTDAYGRQIDEINGLIRSIQQLNGMTVTGFRQGAQSGGTTGGGGGGSDGGGHTMPFGQTDILGPGQREAIAQATAAQNAFAQQTTTGGGGATSGGSSSSWVGRQMTVPARSRMAGGGLGDSGAINRAITNQTHQLAEVTRSTTAELQRIAGQPGQIVIHFNAGAIQVISDGPIDERAGRAVAQGMLAEIELAGSQDTIRWGAG